MANAIKWDAAPTSRGNVLSTELNSLVDNARTAAGSEIDNSVNLDQYGWLELNATFSTGPSDVNPFIAIYMVTAPDGTNYSAGSASVDPGDAQHVLDIPVLGTTSAQRQITKLFRLPPSKFKLIALNESGESFPASGSTIELFTANDEVQ